MDPSTSSLFRTATPHQSVATLFLVENSREMSLIWPDLRDTYLKGLVDNLVAGNSTFPITVSVLESCPLQTHGSNPPSAPRQYTNPKDGFEDVEFNYVPGNAITKECISNCIDFLDTIKYQGQPPVLHLFIVAATSPLEDATNTPYPGHGYTHWHWLAQKMNAKNIHCHIVVSPQHDTGSLTLLFEETLRLQGNIEEPLYPPVDPSRVIVRLSARPNYELHNELRVASYPTGRMTVPRRNSYPLDNFYRENFDDTSGVAGISADGDQPPSLVSQLQQVHGLTKKKVYGAKPVRQPFFRDERVVRDKYRQAPAPLTMPMPMPIMDQTPSPTAGGRAISQSRADRMGRLSQASPTDLHSTARRQHGWTRRGSRLSTPEADNHTWPSPPSMPHDNSPGSSYMSSSPVTPVTTIEEVYQLPPPHHAAACTPSLGTPAASPGISAYQTGGVPEGNWDVVSAPLQFGSYNPSVQTYFPPTTSLFYSDRGHAANQADMAPPPIPPSGSLQPPSNMQPPISASAEMQPPPSIQNGNMNTKSQIHVNSTKRQVVDEDEERFTFGDEFVAATAALFEEEVLPAYPDYPGMSSGLHTNMNAQHNLSPSTSASQAGELYATRNRQQSVAGSGSGSHAAGANMLNNNSNYIPLHDQYSHPTHHAHTMSMVTNAAFPYCAPPAPNYGSSLTGWAGAG